MRPTKKKQRQIDDVKYTNIEVLNKKKRKKQRNKEKERERERKKKENKKSVAEESPLSVTSGPVERKFSQPASDSGARPVPPTHPLHKSSHPPTP